MSLCDIFDGARESIAAALPDATAEMRHGENERGVVLQTSGEEVAEAVSDSAPEEAARFCALRPADFKTLERGSAVEIGESLRVVTSLKRAVGGAHLSFGVSAAFDKCKAAYSGTRRESGAVRNIRHPLDVLALESGGMYESLDSVAPAAETTWTVAIRRADWPETTDPQISDSLSLGRDGQTASNLSLTVAAVSRHDGWYILKCRTRGGRNG